jgi:hypothetical protein
MRGKAKASLLLAIDEIRRRVVVLGVGEHMGVLSVRADGFQGDRQVCALGPGGVGNQRDLGEIRVAGEQDQFVAARIGEGGHRVGYFLW